MKYEVRICGDSYNRRETMAKKKLTKIHLLFNSKLAPFCWLVKIIGSAHDYGVGDNNGNPLLGYYAKMRLKADAVDIAIEQAKERVPSSLRIHRTDGQIQSERSYGAGSESPRKG